MPKTYVTRSQLIKTPIDKVRENIVNFRHWVKWSPWFVIEPTAEIKYDEDDKGYQWKGQYIGEGKMRLKNKNENTINYDLEFLKPWKSKADVSFILEEKNGDTFVTWTMDSSLPWFLFWMKTSLEGFIGLDYERGLLMLKDYCELGKVRTKLEFKGVENFEGCTFIGIRNSSSIAEMDKTMENDFMKLEQYIQGNYEINGQPFSQYHKWDIKNMSAIYTIGFPISESSKKVDKNFVYGKLPQTKVHKIIHHGPYAFLGGAWSAQESMARGKAFKKNKGIHPFEIYVNDPSKVANGNLITAICFPVK